MELAYFINLIFIFSLNMLFFLLGTCLNSLVIISFLRSVQLRKKLCYFMIMVLSCCDLLVVLTYHPLLALFAMLRLTKMFDAYPSWALICTKLFNIFPALSLLALLVMNFDRYLATYYLTVWRHIILSFNLGTRIFQHSIYNCLMRRLPI